MVKSKLLIFFFILSFLSVLFLPAFTFFYLYPSIDNLLIKNAEDQAAMIADHFIIHFDITEDILSRENVSSGLRDEIFEMMNNFSLEQVKLFSATGEVLFSTTPEDIGTINTNDYFRVLVLRGHRFTKMVQKDSQTSEGRMVSRDVIETYVPITSKDKVVGAFEIYYDITRTREMFNVLVRQTSIIIFTISFILLVSLLLSLFKLSRNIVAREQAQKQLNRHRDELEQEVRKRTAELTRANSNLNEDLLKRKETEQALQVSEGKFRSLVEMASDAIFIADADTGIISEVNKKGEELIGRPASDLIGRHLSSLHPSDDEELYSRLIESNYSQQLPVNKVLYVRHISGRKIPVEISANTIEFENERIVQGIFHDISLRLQFEDELQKAEKLKTASILAGGIAHDFNNLLTAVLGNVSLAKMEAGGSEKMKTRLVETEKAIRRAQDLTHQLLTFAKGGPQNKKTVKIGRLIEESAQFVLHGSKVKCTCDLPDDLWPVEVDEGQISQVVNNLVINASHAMAEGGTCSIRAENVEIDAVGGLNVIPGKYVKVAIEDKGHGIPRDTVDKIFDPFFTTKKHGSGLGLSSAYSIVKNHGGQITVESEPGDGTVFYIYLPASKRTSADVEEKKEVDLEGKGKILVMDDEEVVREAVTSLLEYLGYDVETAKEGQEAIEMFKLSSEIGRPYDAVIMDLTVPGGMGGKEAVVKIKELDPSIKVIVSSGYYTDPVLARFRDYGFDGVVPKPYQVEELGTVVKEVLSGAA
ncbi:MAG: ATP-binding protein [Desulfobulbaceae bacterium]|nr:ATP-binding protein [Desulfobulbaceae bacterium]